MKLKSSKVPEDRLMLSIMIAWKTLREEMHWRQPSSPMEWAHQPLLWNPNIAYASGRMLGMDVELSWADLEKQWWPTLAKWWEY